MYLHSCAHIKPSIRSYINTSTHRYIHRDKSAYIGRKIDTKTYFEHITVHSDAIQYKGVQYNTAQYKTGNTLRHVTLQHNTYGQTRSMLILFPSLTLDYLHCISSYYIILHYVALQYSALQ